MKKAVVTEVVSHNMKMNCLHLENMRKQSLKLIKSKQGVCVNNIY